MKKYCTDGKDINYLFISHVKLSSSYGAAQSAQLLISMLSQIRNCNLRVVQIQNIKDYAKGCFINRKNTDMHSMPLPWVNNFDGSLDFKHSILKKIKLLIQNQIALINARMNLRSIIRNNKLKVVHLNSLVLIPIIKLFDKRTDITKICHVREVCISEKITQKLVEKVDLFICIDKATRDRIEYIYGIPPYKLRVIPNSVDVAPIITSDKASSLSGPLKVGLVGQILPHKGHDFVITCFARLPENDFNLIIIGDVFSNAYASSLVRRTSEFKNIFWIGHVDNFFDQAGYSQFDVLLRADPDHRVGRTMYEGLISGNTLLTPLGKNEIITDSLLKKFENNIVTYEPNNVGDLSEKLKQVKERIPTVDYQEISKIVSNYNKQNYLNVAKIIEPLLLE